MAAETWRMGGFKVSEPAEHAHGGKVVGGSRTESQHHRPITAIRQQHYLPFHSNLCLNFYWRHQPGTLDMICHQGGPQHTPLFFLCIRHCPQIPPTPEFRFLSATPPFSSHVSMASSHCPRLLTCHRNIQFCQHQHQLHTG